VEYINTGNTFQNRTPMTEQVRERKGWQMKLHETKWAARQLVARLKR
jgi:hypothetical protein